MLFILAWLPAIVSGVLLGASWIAFWTVGDGSPRVLVPLTIWFLVAAYLQFFAGSLALTTTGLVLQAVLAAYLTIRSKGRRSAL